MATERLDGVRSVALGVWIAGGSRLEPPELAGVSHFIEHLIFKGSETYSAFDIAHLFDDMGAEPNASTSKEHTLVNARLLDEDLPRAVELLAEMVVRPSFAELDQEREVVLEEVAMYEDSPPELVHDDLAEAVFGDHPLGRPIIGHTHTLRALDLARVKAYHDEHYVDPGIVVAAAGHVEHEPFRELVRAAFGDRKAGPAPAAALGAPSARHVAHFTTKDTEQYHLCLGGVGPRRDAPDRYAAFVVDTILGGSWSSRLFQEVREKRGLAYSVYSYNSLYADAGLTAVYVGSREEAVAEAFGVVLDVLQRARERPLRGGRGARPQPPEGPDRAEHGEPGEPHAGPGTLDPDGDARALGRRHPGAHRRRQTRRRAGRRGALLRSGGVVGGLHRPRLGAAARRHRRLRLGGTISGMRLRCPACVRRRRGAS